MAEDTAPSPVIGNAAPPPPSQAERDRIPLTGAEAYAKAYSIECKLGASDTPLDAHLAKLRIVEALLARDHAVYRMDAICTSIHQKNATITQLEQDKRELEAKLAAYTLTDTADEEEEKQTQETMKEIERLHKLNRELHREIGALKQRLEEDANETTVNAPGPPTLVVDVKDLTAPPPSKDEDSECPVDILSPISRQGVRIATEDSEPPESIIQSRYAILAELPLPPNMPCDMLVPIIIPQPFTIHDFISTVVGPAKAQLTNYRVFQESTTSWCPEREEHGYYLTPFYKCSTNPRVATAHRWAPVDLAARVNKPTECFYNKEGKWYYAGVYKSFRLRDITPQEWVELPPETTQALVKETLTGRKNTSPQNIYEAGQLYAAGALKAACIGLQCIGFDEKLYHALLFQADVCLKTGRWRGPVSGLGTGAVWNVSANGDNGGEVGAPPGIVQTLEAERETQKTPSVTG